MFEGAAGRSPSAHAALAFEPKARLPVPIAVSKRLQPAFKKFVHERAHGVGKC